MMFSFVVPLCCLGRSHSNDFNWDSYIFPMTYKLVLLFTVV